VVNEWNILDEEIISGCSLAGFKQKLDRHLKDYSNLSSDLRGKSNDLGVSSVSRIHFGCGFIVNPDPDPIIEYSPLETKGDKLAASVP